MGLAAAVHNRLTTTAAVTATIGTYQGEPAVFTSIPIPEDAGTDGRAFIVLDPDGSDETLCKDRSVRERTISIDCWIRDTGSHLDLEAVSEAVIEAIDDQPVDWPGWRGVVAACDAGERADTDADYLGWTIQSRFINEKEG